MTSYIKQLSVAKPTASTPQLREIQSTPDNSNLQRKSKKVRVIGSSKKIAGSKKKKNSFYCMVNILITFNLEMSIEN